MASLAEILKQKHIESRRKITDDVINAVIQSLKTEMNTVADKGENLGYIDVGDECRKLENFNLDENFNFYFGLVKRYGFGGYGWWRNFWGLKGKDNPNDNECQWILHKIILKGIFKGINIGMCRQHKYLICFKL